MLKTLNSRNPSRLLPWTIVIIAFVLLWAAITLVYGLRTTGLAEEWNLFYAFDTGESWQNLLPLNRLAQYVPFYLGYLLTPDSFVGLNLVAVLTLFAKMCLLYAVFKSLLRPHHSLAFIASVLVMLYPADLGTFYLRFLAYHWVICCYLLAFYMLLRWLQHPRLIYLLIMVLAQLQCLLSYEVAWPLVFLTPVALLWLRPRIKRPLLQTSIIWLVIPVAVVLFMITIWFVGRATYQSQILASSNPDIGASVVTIIIHIGRLYLQHFGLAWYLALSLPLSLQARLLSLLLGIFVGVVSYRYQPDSDAPLQSRRWLLVGLAIMFLGFLPFLPSDHHRLISERVFLLTSVGAALTLTIFLWSIVKNSKHRRIAFTIGITFLTVVASFWTFQRIERTQEYSDIEYNILSTIATTMPRWTSDQVLVVLIDRTTSLANGETLFVGNHYSGSFNAALRYIYHSSAVVGVLCFPETLTWRVERETCTFGEDAFAFRGLDNQTMTYPYSQVMVFEYTGETTLLSPQALQGEGVTNADYNPNQLVDSAAALPHRAVLLGYQ
ncbi:MAG: hypothetical protein U0694_10955 [Anaerolineae bacterium]